MTNGENIGKTKLFISKTPKRAGKKEEERRKKIE